MDIIGGKIPLVPPMITTTAEIFLFGEMRRLSGHMYEVPGNLVLAR